MSAATGGVLFETDTLIPAAWRGRIGDGPVRAFNPGLLRDGERWIMAQRIVGGDGARRIALCRLDSQLRVVAGSPVAFSDGVRFRAEARYEGNAHTWFADPRLYRFGIRVFVYWNSGWHEPRNCQFLVEIDPATLRPLGLAREMVLRGERQKLEKNWTLFADEAGRLRAIYSIAPHRVLEFTLEGENDIVFEESARTEWLMAGYPASHGGLRGGAPPHFLGGRFWSFGHSVHDSSEGYRYVAAAYSFSATPPFAPLSAPKRPLELWNPFGGKRTHERLNSAVGEVIYPCGAVHDDARWVIGHGINDEYCALSFVEHAAVADTQRGVADSP